MPDGPVKDLFAKTFGELDLSHAPLATPLPEVKVLFFDETIARSTLALSNEDGTDDDDDEIELTKAQMQPIIEAQVEENPDQTTRTRLAREARSKLKATETERSGRDRMHFDCAITLIAITPPRPGRSDRKQRHRNEDTDETVSVHSLQAKAPRHLRRRCVALRPVC